MRHHLLLLIAKFKENEISSPKKPDMYFSNRYTWRAARLEVESQLKEFDKAHYKCFNCGQMMEYRSNV